MNSKVGEFLIQTADVSGFCSQNSLSLKREIYSHFQTNIQNCDLKKKITHKRGIDNKVGKQQILMGMEKIYYDKINFSCFFFFF